MRDTRGTPTALGRTITSFEHSVNAIADGDTTFSCLQVDVARARRDSLGNNVIDQFYHWPLRLLFVDRVLSCVGSFHDGLDPVTVGAANHFVEALDRRIDLFDPLLNAGR